MNATRLIGAALAGLMVLTACVTINVYFPAAAAEKAADAIIEEVWGTQSIEEELDSVEPEASLHTTNILASIVDILIPVAHAQADLKISTPTANKLKASMRARHRKLVEYYMLGAAGLTRDGLIAVRDAKLAALNKRNALKQLVAAENKDRNALYAELAAANGHPEWQPEIRDTFARRWISKAKKGWWFDGGSGWQQK
jgi:uncharacterized protein YdbL (DUF1318 family)